MDRGIISDANDAKLAGMYWTDNRASNVPVADWMLLWVFTSNNIGNYILFYTTK